jgi:acyl-coenzyme A thioesterase PaaI-like protein
MREPRTHQSIDPQLVGRPVELGEGVARAALLTTAAMAADARGLVHGGFVFGLADYAAMLAVNDPNVVLAGADTKFLRPVVVGEELIADARVEGAAGRKRTVAVVVRRGADEPGAVGSEDRPIFTGTFVAAVLDQHVLDGRK